MDYDQFRIKSYQSWDLFLHMEQHPYLGRAYAWALRDTAIKIADMNEAERKELFDVVLPQWDRAVKKVFQHDWVNITYLGNTTQHLHWHFIPRYHTPKKAYDMTFTDPNPTGNYAPYPKRIFPLEMHMQIKEEIMRNLE